MANREPCGFRVRRVAAQELPDLNAYVVGLAEDPEGAGASLIFSVPLEPDGQDEGAGLGAYCLSTGGGATAYGGVEECTLSGGALELLVSPATAATLGISERCRLELLVDEVARQQLASGLRRIFAAGPDAPAVLRL